MKGLLERTRRTTVENLDRDKRKELNDKVAVIYRFGSKHNSITSCLKRNEKLLLKLDSCYTIFNLAEKCIKEELPHSDTWHFGSSPVIKMDYILCKVSDTCFRAYNFRESGALEKEVINHYMNGEALHDLIENPWINTASTHYKVMGSTNKPEKTVMIGLPDWFVLKTPFTENCEMKGFFSQKNQENIGYVIYS